MDETVAVNMTCLLCNNYFDQKPYLLKSELTTCANVKEESNRAILIEFKKALRLFCHLAKINCSSEEDGSVLTNNGSERDGDDECENEGALPCCGSCNVALVDLIKLEKIIKETRMQQGEVVSSLTQGVLRNQNGRSHLDVEWAPIRTVLVKGLSVPNYSQIVESSNNDLFMDSEDVDFFDCDENNTPPVSPPLSTEKEVITYMPVRRSSRKRGISVENLGEDFEQFQEIKWNPRSLSDFKGSTAAAQIESISMEKKLPESEDKTRVPKKAKLTAKRIGQTAKKSKIKALKKNMSTGSSKVKIAVKNKQATVKSSRGSGIGSDSDSDHLIDEDVTKIRDSSERPKASKKVYGETESGIKIRRMANDRYNGDQFFLQLSSTLLLYRNVLVKVSATEFTCQEISCNLIIPSSDYYIAFQEFKKHVSECHTILPQYTDLSCPICSEKFTEKIYFRGHIFQQHFRPPVICEICWKPMKSYQSTAMKNHVWFHMNEEEQKLATVEGRQKRSVQCFSRKRGSYSCSTCFRVCNTVEDLRRHQMVHLPRHLRPQFACPECKISFLSKKTLQVHIQRIHKPESAQRKRECKFCGKQFRFVDGELFRCHLRTHTKETPWVCEICGKGFTARRTFRVHQRDAHHNQKLYQCELCPRSYKQLRSLQQHLKTPHTESYIARVAEKTRKRSPGKKCTRKKKAPKKSDLNKDIKPDPEELDERDI